MKLKIINSKQYVFDAIRKKWLLLTPEEMVRQQVVAYLITHKKVPSTVFALEKLVKINNISRRFDILVYNQSAPWLLVECKEPNVVLNDATVQQLLNYNNTLKVSYLAITNGRDLLVWKVENSKVTLQEDFPNWV